MLGILTILDYANCTTSHLACTSKKEINILLIYSTKIFIWFLLQRFTLLEWRFKNPPRCVDFRKKIEHITDSVNMCFACVLYTWLNMMLNDVKMRWLQYCFRVLPKMKEFALRNPFIILDISFLYIFSQRKHFSITIFLTQILMSETYPKTFTFLLAQVSSKFWIQGITGLKQVVLEIFGSVYS